MDRGAWQATVQGVAKSQRQLSVCAPSRTVAFDRVSPAWPNGPGHRVSIGSRELWKSLLLPESTLVHVDYNL